MNTVFDYDKIADNYDAWYETPQGQAVDKLEKQHLAMHLKKIPVGNQIVELGAGTGHWSAYFSAQGYSVVGIDISTEMLKQAVAKKIPSSTFLLADMTDLPFPDESVDYLIAVTSVEFTPNPQKTMEECYRILRPNGIFIMATLNANGSLQQKRILNPLFKDVKYFTYDTLLASLMHFGEPEVDGSVLMPDVKADVLSLLNAEKKASRELLDKNGNFLLGSVQKTR